ncbi:hypothetical protein BO86DRAFT_398220 [Aspergillus japonicus CBS 114.51]|uniref:Uncharacterized protein n=1 Tax=Aspergillus japonicus CBS 114.51 TaxID=1448312 RepID=A0A8T8X6U9_ASPJA|nr:hypothetical protein BO86DRAFT_398220 [Aspergillus japonicus CBS 114.51]RAH83179.1 hypothetical protein BO86DRAFT_398220 [Aspergillus japonicus CBS 114.51]
MRVNIKSLFVLILALSGVACYPIAKSPMHADAGIFDLPERDLVPRAKLRPINCGGQRFNRDEINGATKQARIVEEAKARNLDGNLHEYPLTSGDVYSGKGEPTAGLYRVVVNEKYKFMGMLEA